MLEFKEISLQDKQWMQEYFNKSQFGGCEYSFTTSFIWAKNYGLEVAQSDGMMVIFSKTFKSFLYPCGDGDLKAVVEKMIEYADQNGFEFCMHSVLKPGVDRLQQLFPDKFNFEQTRDYFDYIYDAQSLITLAGKKLHSKRNHVNRFKENNWRYERINRENIDLCTAMNNEWCKQNNCESDDGKKTEACAVRRCIKNFFDLDLDGGVLYVDDKVVAFTIGEKLNDDTYLVHIEKAFADIQGAYPMINQQFASDVAVDCKYINREDDSGQEGLRKAKLSYRPEILLEKHNVTLI